MKSWSCATGSYRNENFSIIVVERISLDNILLCRIFIAQWHCWQKWEIPISLTLYRRKHVFQALSIPIFATQNECVFVSKWCSIQFNSNSLQFNSNGAQSKTLSHRWGVQYPNQTLEKGWEKQKGSRIKKKPNKKKLTIVTTVIFWDYSPNISSCFWSLAN